MSGEQHIEASHAEVAWDQQVTALQHERWRRMDEQASPRSPAAPARKRPAQTPRRASPPKPPAVPDGWLVLTATEVEALDRLLSTHPAVIAERAKAARRAR